jgi:hypothetical protein
VTLILSVLTREFAMQASDRRLTDRTGHLVDNHANKAIVWGGAVTFAFTGLAGIGSERTDIWMAKAMRHANGLPGALDNVCKQAQKHPRIRQKPLAIVGAGVMHDPHTKHEGRDRIMPTICWAGNCLDDRGNPAPVNGNWTAGGRWIEVDEPFLLHVAGQQLEAEELSQLLAALNTASSAGEGPALVAALLRDTIRAVSVDRSTPERHRRARTVGKGVLITCLPYTTIGPIPIGGQLQPALFIPEDPNDLGGFEVGQSRYMLASEPRLDAQTFMYVPPDTNRGIWRGPTWTWPRGMVLTDFATRFGGGPPGPPGPPGQEGRSAWMKIAALPPGREDPRS